MLFDFYEYFYRLVINYKCRKKVKEYIKKKVTLLKI